MCDHVTSEQEEVSFCQQNSYKGVFVRRLYICLIYKQFQSLGFELRKAGLYSKQTRSLITANSQFGLSKVRSFSLISKLVKQFQQNLQEKGHMVTRVTVTVLARHTLVVRSTKP